MEGKKQYKNESLFYSVELQLLRTKVHGDFQYVSCLLQFCVFLWLSQIRTWKVDGPGI
jgi:hypothetical protein